MRSGGFSGATHYTANGPEGLAGGKRVINASARGGLYADPTNDFQEPYLSQVLGFLGIDDISSCAQKAWRIRRSIAPMRWPGWVRKKRLL